MKDVYYALGLHMHQPPGNLELLIENNEWEAHQIICCYERVAKYAQKFIDVAKLHVGFSGILLRQLVDDRIIKRYHQFVDIPQMLELYRKSKNIELLGMGFYHPVFPLIPQDDWYEHLIRGRRIIKEIFGEEPIGFWPSEMAFCMEMIPYLKRVGYEYVVVDHVHIVPLGHDEVIHPFYPCIARYNSDEIIVIPRHRDLSNAQESGLNPSWFISEVESKTKDIDSKEDSFLVTTWSDGENGGWFRQMDEKSGFWGYFFAPLMEMIRAGSIPLIPVKISQFINDNRIFKEVKVNTGAWNVGDTSGYDFSQWNGSPLQKKAIADLFQTSNKYWELKGTVKNKEKEKILDDAYEFILDAETSCYLFWGDNWVHRIYDKLERANELLKKIQEV